MGGVGLSGVGYGLFGLLYVLSQYDERFRDSVDKSTVNLFIGWFFFCIFATVTHMFNVANVAHGAGALFGALLGCAIVLPERRRLIAGAGTALVLVGLSGATFARPLVNFSKYGGYEESTWGYDALIANRDAEAVRWYTDVVRYQPKIAPFWFNLGIAHQRLNQAQAASSAYKRA
jgi:hypothetical protein